MKFRKSGAGSTIRQEIKRIRRLTVAVHLLDLFIRSRSEKLSKGLAKLRSLASHPLSPRLTKEILSPKVLTVKGFDLDRLTHVLTALEKIGHERNRRSERHDQNEIKKSFYEVFVKHRKSSSFKASGCKLQQNNM